MYKNYIPQFHKTYPFSLSTYPLFTLYIYAHTRTHARTLAYIVIVNYIRIRVINNIRIFKHCFNSKYIHINSIFWKKILAQILFIIIFIVVKQIVCETCVLQWKIIKNTKLSNCCAPMLHVIKIRKIVCAINKKKGVSIRNNHIHTCMQQYYTQKLTF